MQIDQHQAKQKHIYFDLVVMNIRKLRGCRKRNHLGFFFVVLTAHILLGLVSNAQAYIFQDFALS